MGFLGKFGQSIGKFAQSALGQMLIPSGVQFGADMIMAKKQREYATDMWNKQNSYNSPVQQLARYREAGMNPAYGAGMASGNAEKISDAAASVAKLQMPNVLENLGMYQSLKNQVLEGDRIKAVTEGEILKNQFMNISMESRLQEIMERVGLTMQKKWSEKQRAGFLIDLTDSGMNPMKMGYQLDEQRLNQNSQMFDIDLALNKIGLNRAKFGLTDSDSAFLRVLAQMWNGSEKGSNSMMPYVIGEKAVGFIGDVVKDAVPKLPWQRYKFDVNPFEHDKRGLRYWK